MINWGRISAVLALMAALSAGIWKIHHTGVVEGRAEVQSQWNLAKLAQSESDLKLETETRLREQQLQNNADDLRRTKDAQLNKIAGSLRAALAANSLLRAARPTGYTPAPPGTGPLCSGASLFREDADFLSRESARADGLRAAYINCEAQYAAARKAVNTEPTGVKVGVDASEVK